MAQYIERLNDGTERVVRYNPHHDGPVTERLTAIKRMLESETNPQGIDRLCAALARLHEIERQCAGRSLPASLKAKEVTAPKRAPAGPTTPVQTE